LVFTLGGFYECGGVGVGVEIEEEEACAELDEYLADFAVGIGQFGAITCDEFFDEAAEGVGVDLIGRNNHGRYVIFRLRGLLSGKTGGKVRKSCNRVSGF